MRAFSFKAAFLILSLGYASSGAPAVNEPQPLLVIWQQSEYPAPGREPVYAYGLVAVIWTDGRVIRANDKASIGKAYTEGRARQNEFDDFVRFLASPTILAMPDEFAVAVDSASRSITIRHAGEKHKWTRTIPDQRALLNEIEARTWTLPLDRTSSLDPKKADLLRFRDR
jgi:hypothetical protein